MDSMIGQLGNVETGGVLSGAVKEKVQSSRITGCLTKTACFTQGRYLEAGVSQLFVLGDSYPLSEAGKRPTGINLTWPVHVGTYLGT